MAENLALRIAFRVEGSMWNAYVAKTGTMDGAFLIGSIGMGPVSSDPEMKQRFMDLMQDAFAQAITQHIGLPIEKWNIQSAPEHERGGNA